MRRFESEYRIGPGDTVLSRENAIHQDLDLRLDHVEEAAEAFRDGNRADVDALVSSIQKTFARLAADMEALLSATAGGISADVVQETAARSFLTPARLAALLEELRGGVDPIGDTLAKLLALVSQRPTAISVDQALAALAPKASPVFTGQPEVPTAGAGTDTRQAASTAFVAAAVAALKNNLVNGAGTALDQFNELAAALGNDPNFAATIMAALALRLRFDVAQALNATQRAQGLANLGAQPALGYAPVQQGGGNGQVGNKIYIGHAVGGPKIQVDATDFGKLWTDSAGAASLAGSGYQRLPSGLILQWGIAAVDTGQLNVTFPVRFPSVVASITATNNYGVSGGQAFTTAFDNDTVTGFRVFTRQILNGGNVSAAGSFVRWMAIGW